MIGDIHTTTHKAHVVTVNSLLLKSDLSDHRNARCFSSVVLAPGRVVRGECIVEQLDALGILITRWNLLTEHKQTREVRMAVKNTVKRTNFYLPGKI